MFHEFEMVLRFPFLFINWSFYGFSCNELFLYPPKQVFFLSLSYVESCNIFFSLVSFFMIIHMFLSSFNLSSVSPVYILLQSLQLTSYANRETSFVSLFLNLNWLYRSLYLVNTVVKPNFLNQIVIFWYVINNLRGSNSWFFLTNDSCYIIFKWYPFNCIVFFIYVSSSFHDISSLHVDFDVVTKFLIIDGFT